MSKRKDNEAIKVASLKTRESFLAKVEFEKNIKQHIQDKELIKALSSQSSWANYVRDGFVFMSLNTYKTYANKYLFDGFTGIDKKRIEAYALIEEQLKHVANPSRTVRSDTKKGLKIKSDIKDKQLSIVREANLVLSKGLMVMMDTMDKLATDTEDSNIIDIVENEMSKVKALLLRSSMLSELDDSLSSETDS